MTLTVDNETVSDFADIDDVISAFDRILSGNRTIIIEDGRTGSYFQSICGQYNGIAEIRVYSSGDDFRHFRAEVGEDVTGTVKINNGNFIMEVPRRQLMNSASIKRAAAKFLNTGSTYSGCRWTDITEDFLHL